MRRNVSGIIWGLALITLGVVILMDRLGYREFDFGRFLHTWWPLILIFVGLGILFDNPRERKEK
jgi:hypothetical protein